ncbi:cupin [Endobacterium cereale]|uniref:cupin n=1 Tax=Endobacterium cereale TaxID=2663029 RepID=UPI002B478B22|nr:cupin [Endobacterium cereale]MEB2846659.1 cupin [Endobacterium cereale]
MMARKIIFPASEWVPNNPRFPVLVYKVALTDAKSFENLFASNGWSGIWTNGVFDYQHYHSAAHEALGIRQGHATLLIGGPGGEAMSVEQGDCLVLPAGTGHRNLDCSADFQVVGAYPPGQQADILTAAATSRQLATIRSLPRPETDPVTGASVGLIEAWGSGVPVE